MTAAEAGCLTLAGLLDVLGHAGRPVIHQPPMPQPAEAPRGSSTTLPANPTKFQPRQALKP